MTIEDCEFLGNSSGGEGDALYLRVTDPSESRVLRSSFTGNSAPNGGNGFLPVGSYMIRCCYTEPLGWVAEKGATIVFDDDDCTVGTDSSTWARIKALYR